MRIPFYQQLFRYTLDFLTGVLLIGALLDAIANALNIVTPVATYNLTFVITVGWILLEVFLKRRGLLWVITGRKFRISKLGPQIRLGIIGIIVLLWLPRVLYSPAGISPTIKQHEPSDLALTEASGKKVVWDQDIHLDKSRGSAWYGHPLYVKVDGNERMISAQARQVWRIDGGQLLAFTQNEGTGYPSHYSEFSSLNIYSPQTNKMWRVLAGTDDIVSVTELKSRSERTALVVDIRTNGKGDEYVRIVDPLRGTIDFPHHYRLYSYRNTFDNDDLVFESRSGYQESYRLEEVLSRPSSKILQRFALRSM